MPYPLIKIVPYFSISTKQCQEEEENTKKLIFCKSKIEEPHHPLSSAPSLSKSTRLSQQASTTIFLCPHCARSRRHLTPAAGNGHVVHALMMTHQHLPEKGGSAPAGDANKASIVAAKEEGESFVAAKEEGEVIDPSGEEREGEKGIRL